MVAFADKLWPSAWVALPPTSGAAVGLLIRTCRVASSQQECKCEPPDGAHVNERAALRYTNFVPATQNNEGAQDKDHDEQDSTKSITSGNMGQTKQAQFEWSGFMSLYPASITLNL